MSEDKGMTSGGMFFLAGIGIVAAGFIVVAIAIAARDYKPETVADRAKLIESNCEREFPRDEYRANQCKFRLLLELRLRIDENRINSARPR